MKTRPHKHLEYLGPIEAPIVRTLLPLPLRFRSALVTARQLDASSQPKYEVCLELDQNLEVTRALHGLLQATFKAQYERYQAGGGRKPARVDRMPMTRAKDRDNNPEPEKLIFRASTSDNIKGDPRRVPIVDRFNQPMSLDHELGPGSLVCVQFSPRIYGETQRTVDHIGLTAYLDAVVVITVQEGSGAGFDSEAVEAIDLSGVPAQETTRGGASPAPSPAPSFETDWPEDSATASPAPEEAEEGPFGPISRDPFGGME